jgi:exodeoxyribonuclease X
MAKKLIPDLPTYSNMALHYRLGLPGRPENSHRAHADAKVTANLYLYLLDIVRKTATDPEFVDADRFINFINAPMMEKTIKFGKYFGQPWAEVAKTDKSYLRWVLEKSDIAEKNPDVRFTVETLLKGA